MSGEMVTRGLCNRPVRVYPPPGNRQKRVCAEIHSLVPTAFSVYHFCAKRQFGGYLPTAAETIGMIPAWNSQGVLPPVRPGAGGNSADRAPYRVSLEHLVGRFAVSLDRAQILQGFLDHRAALHQLGIVSGFQWVDGSFAEDIETLEARPPNDIDVVAFYPFVSRRHDMMLLQNYPHIFDAEYSREKFNVDAYFYPINTENTRDMIRWVTYWYSMWSHRRSVTRRSARRRGALHSAYARINLWKGFVEVELFPDRDVEARNALDLIIRQRGAQ